jgi:hypothetical protein
MVTFGEAGLTAILCLIGQQHGCRRHRAAADCWGTDEAMHFFPDLDTGRTRTVTIANDSPGTPGRLRWTPAHLVIRRRGEP